MGAEIVFHAHTGVPDSGWEELPIRELREMHKQAAERLNPANPATQPDRSHHATRLHGVLSTALEKADLGERIFTAHSGGTHYFAATDAHTGDAPR